MATQSQITSSILMPQVLQPVGAPPTVQQTLSKAMHRGSTIAVLAAVVAAYGFVEDSKPAKWVGIAGVAYGAWSWWKAYQQNNAVVAQQQSSAAYEAQIAADRASGTGTPSGMINGMGTPPEPDGILPGRSPLRSVPQT